jgi:beta-lactamase regulating signal transducer with metallopeptidase domain
MMFRFARLSHASRRAIAQWMRSAEAITLPGISVPTHCIDAAFPVVAIAGVFRPRLLIAKSVLKACRPNELQAILAHERWHLHHGDNLRRLLVAASPDVLMWTPLSRRLSALWQSAAEDAADAEAASSHPAGRVSLAEALIRIGRLAPAGHSPSDLPASTLFRGENLERRIRRLLDPEADLGGRRERPFWLVATAASLLAVSLFALRPIHELVEAAVAFLP